MLRKLKSAWLARDRVWRDTWAGDLSQPGARRNAVLDMTVFDHGLLRWFWTNLDEIAPGVWRSNQPSPRMIARLARKGIRTIVNFRGQSDWGSYLLEAEAAQRHGVTLVDYRLYSRKAPARAEILGAMDLFGRIDRPFLMHCKSGADRAGLGAAIYLLMHGATPDAAARQLSLRYLHVRAAKTGILDAFVAMYARHHAGHGTDFATWVRDIYDPADLTASFKVTGPGSFLVDKVLRRE